MGKTEELKKEARKARDNTTDYYTIVATGNTYPVKDDLQSWAFFWDADKRAWINECASEFERFLFGRFVADGDWSGVKLEITKNSKEEYENKI